MDMDDAICKLCMVQAAGPDGYCDICLDAIEDGDLVVIELINPCATCGAKDAPHIDGQEHPCFYCEPE